LAIFSSERGSMIEFIWCVIASERLETDHASTDKSRVHASIQQYSLHSAIVQSYSTRDMCYLHVAVC
jgi:hypothetical protein